MAGSTFGKIFSLTTFGESHGPAIGGVIDGCPAGLTIDEKKISHQLSRRKPGQSRVTSDRKEDEEFEILSGVFEGVTSGTPIGFIIRNKDQKPEDYDKLKDVYRPSHSDYTFQMKYGIRDHRGGGRSSARETAARVLAGSIAEQLISLEGIRVSAYVTQVGSIALRKEYGMINREEVDKSIVRCPEKDTSGKMIAHIEELKKSGDSTGGVIHCVISGVPVGLGEPVFDKLQADLAHAMLSINAVHGFEYGSGFAGTKMKGSEHNDLFTTTADGKIITETNRSGGIQGGLSNGMDIYFNVAFKPVSTIAKKQNTVNLSGEKTEISVEGRHDPCVVPRAVPIVEAMASIVIADHLLRNRLSKITNQKSIQK